MRKSIAIITIALFSIVLICACKKSTSNAAIATSVYIPRGADSLMEIPQAQLIGPPMSNVSGVLVACKTSGIVIDTSGLPISYNRMWEAAIFESQTNTFGDAGTVSINSVLLNGDRGYYYLHYDTTPTWNESSSNHWVVSGTVTIPAISVDIPGTFPAFTDTLPTVISRAGDFSIELNSSNTLNADSGYVVIYCAPRGSRLIGNVVSANGGVSKVNASELIYLQNGNAPFNSRSLASQGYYGGLIMLVLYNHSIQTIGGKKFAFVKQREYLGKVTFL